MTTTSKCGYCGHKGEDVRTHSGIEECTKCWDYRKLDRPAALHWSEAAAMFLSNVDMYDIMNYLPDCGMTKEEMHTMLTCARRVEVHSRYLKEKGRPHKWDEETKQAYDKEMRKTRGE